MKTSIHMRNGDIQISNEQGAVVKGIASSSDNGLTPIELLTSSLGLCVFITLSKMFERDAIEMDEDQLSIAVSAKKAESSPARIESFDVEITMPEHLEESYRAKLVRSAKRACTIGNTLKQGTTINYLDGRMGNKTYGS